jgi:hypothetical protein
MSYQSHEIDNMLRMRGNSRKVTFRYDLLNKNDIKIGELDGITGKVSYGDFRQIKRTATFTLNEYLQREIDYLSDQIQPFFILEMPDGSTVEWSLGIFLLSSPSRSINGEFKNRDIGAFDKSIIVDETRLNDRYFIPQGMEYTGSMIKLLQMAGILKFNIPISNSLMKSDREFPIGEKIKDVFNQLASEINYTSLYVDELGYVRSEPYILPNMRPITQTYKADRDSIILPQLTESLDLAGRFNVFTRVSSDLEAGTEYVSTFKNSNILSPISILNRGREITSFDVVENISSQQQLDNLVKRIATENSQAYTHLSFSTALMPTHGSTDTLYLDIPAISNTPMKFTETAWEMDLRFNGVMTHEARKVIEL